jgi:hypothetical protein
MNFLYYWTVVPVLALVGAIPISPQGVGVMESFAVLLTQKQGVTVSQAIALAMSIRVGQMFWNLLAGGAFVLRGGYHSITEREQQELETDEPSEEEKVRTEDCGLGTEVAQDTQTPGHRDTETGSASDQSLPASPRHRVPASGTPSSVPDPLPSTQSSVLSPQS